MSLDVALILPEVPPAASRERIFIRREGATVELSRAEWDELYPGVEPVTMLDDEPELELYWANITHNLGRMARAAGLYYPLWRPEELALRGAGDLIEPLREGLARLRADREYFEQFNPENGWGDYEGLVRFTEDYLAACERWPEAEVWACR